MGPLFEGTQFDGLKERGATMSPMLMLEKLMELNLTKMEK